VKQHSLVHAAFLPRVRRQVLLLIVAGLAAIVITPLASAQTCQDGCFYSNTYQGDDALLNFGSGGNNSAFGIQALWQNNGGTDNTAVGAFTLSGYYGGPASYNTAVGSLALGTNNTGNDNTAVGANALPNSLDGNGSTAIGAFALYSLIKDSLSTGGIPVARQPLVMELSTAIQAWRATLPLILP